MRSPHADRIAVLSDVVLMLPALILLFAILFDDFPMYVGALIIFGLVGLWVLIQKMWST